MPEDLQGVQPSEGPARLQAPSLRPEAHDVHGSGGPFPAGSLAGSPEQGDCTASVLQAELARKRDPKPKTNDKTTQDKDEEEDGGRTQEEADEEEEEVGR